MSSETSDLLSLWFLCYTNVHTNGNKSDLGIEIRIRKKKTKQNKTKKKNVYRSLVWFIPTTCI